MAPAADREFALDPADRWLAAHPGRAPRLRPASRRARRLLGSMLRPILNMRPKFRTGGPEAPARFPAPTCTSVDWLEPRASRSTTSPTTTSTPRASSCSAVHGRRVGLAPRVLDRGDARRARGLPRRRRPVHVPRRQRLVRVVSVDPDRPHLLEVRRWGTGWPPGAAAGRALQHRHRRAGRPWRNRGRGPHALVGLGTAQRRVRSRAGTAARPTPTTRARPSSSKGSTTRLIGDSRL